MRSDPLTGDCVWAMVPPPFFLFSGRRVSQPYGSAAFLADSGFLPIFFLCRSSSSYGITAIWLQLPEAGAILEIVLHGGLPFHNEHSGRFWLTRYQATVFWVIRPYVPSRFGWRRE